MAVDLSGVTKYFTKASDGFATTLDGSITDSDTTVSLSAFSGYTNGDSVFFTIDATDGSGTATPALREVIYGEKSGSDLINVVRGVEGTAQTHASGANVADYVTAAHWSALNTGLLVQHKNTGAHANTITTDTINENTSANGVTIDSFKVKDGNIVDSNGNEVIKPSGVASAVNEIAVVNAVTTESPEIQATGGDTNIDVDIVPKGTGEVTKAGNPIDWWEEIGRTTLGSAGDTITVSSLPARKYLKVLIDSRDTGGTLSIKVTFNGDTGSNYAQRGLDNAVETTFTSQTGITLSTSTNATSSKVIAEIENIPTIAKLWNSITVNRGPAGAGSLPANRTVYAKWENTSAQISSITVTNSGTGDYAIGSEVVVLGHD